MPTKKPAKTRKSTKKPRTLLQQVDDLRDELMDALLGALEEVFDNHSDPPLPGGRYWQNDLGADIKESVNDFADEAKEDVRETVLKLAKEAAKKPKKPKK